MMSKIFEGDSDSEVEIRTDNQYAKNYDGWRKKEELNKLKTKYGDDVNLDEQSSDSSSDDDEEGIELTEENERDFFKTLACLKNKDPRIYNENVTFFQDKREHLQVSIEKKKKKKDDSMYLKDYERKIILEKGGMLSDEENNQEDKPEPFTYVKEQKNIIESIKKASSGVDDNTNDEGLGGLFQKRRKTQEEKEKDVDYNKWFLGEREKIGEEVETELKPLKEYWNNPNLDDGERFLRDYILNKKFLDKDNDDYIPTYEEIIHDSDQDLSNDEDTLQEQEEFEHKYNFRFEEPDQEFIKRYPRTMEHSVRKKDDKRKVKRQEIKERKKIEKEEKMKDLKKLQELKRKEIEEKLEKLKEITGNTDIAFENNDIDGDFDPEEHDKRMQALFNQDYYEGPEEEQKPVFPEIDEELEIESWDRYEGENKDNAQHAVHCEDDDFNMDCDYDPDTPTQNVSIEESKSKRKRKRKSKVAEALSKPKPKFDPNDKTYEKYFDEYYKLDCEDVIGDIPCRFKYRTVVPNDFGLSVEEILLAKERELNKWCSLKKAVQIRPDHVEKYEQIAYKKKAENMNLKKRIFPSLFTPDPEEKNDENLDVPSKSNNTSDLTDKNIKNESVVSDKDSNARTTAKKKKSNNNNKNIKTQDNQYVNSQNTEKCKTKKKTIINVTNDTNKSQNHERKRKISVNGQVEVPRKKIKKNKKQNRSTKELDISDARLSAYGINPKKFKNKIKFGNKKIEK